MSQIPSTIGELQSAYGQKKVSAQELVKTLLDRIQASKHNAFLHVMKDRAIKQAAEADRQIAQNGADGFTKKPLLGVPIALKDNLVVEGVKTTCGSKILENYIPPYTATAVERLEAAGAISIGKTNMDEFAMGSSNENSAFGPVAHPTHPEYVPGGSSGGSATAVGAGLAFAALGSDTGGSIREPASFSGIVGFKPSYGRVSRYGLVAFASSLDQIGPMTRNVSDAARVFYAMAGHDPRDSTSNPAALSTGAQKDLFKDPSASWKGLKVGVPKEYFIGGLEADVEKSVRRTLDLIHASGAEMVEISLPHTSSAVAVYYLVAVSEASSNLARFDGVRYGSRPKETESAKSLAEFYEIVRAQFGEEVKRRIILGTFALSAGYSDAYFHKACQVRRLMQEDFVHAYQKVDVIATPVAPTTAFKRGEKIDDPLKMYLNDIFTIPANLAGIPAISIPCGKDQAGLPIGFQLMGRFNDDDRVLGLAHATEKLLEKGGH